MALSDRQILELLTDGKLVLTPLDEDQVQPSSVDLKLGDTARTILGDRELDTASDLADRFGDAPIPDEGLLIPPGSVVFSSTREHMVMPDNCQGLVEQRSSLTRIGLQVLSSVVHPGYRGNLALALINHTRAPIRIYRRLAVCQMTIIELSSRPLRTYAEKEGAKYQDERPARLTRISEDVAAIRLRHSVQRTIEGLLREAEAKGLL